MARSFSSTFSRLAKLLLLATLSTPPALAQPREPAALGAWALEPSPFRCVISRRYDAAEAPVTLGIKASPLGDALQIVIIRPGFRREKDATGAQLTIGKTDIETSALSYKLDARGHKVAHLINLGKDDVATLRSASRIRINITEGADLMFGLAPMASAWASLDQCLARLRESWNIDEAGKDRLAAGPEPVVPLASLVNDRDYPGAAIRDKKGGATAFVLLVDEQGVVQDCTLTETSGAAVLDARACGIVVARARFKPATDRDGKAVRGVYSNRIRWVIS